MDSLIEKLRAKLDNIARLMAWQEADLVPRIFVSGGFSPLWLVTLVWTPAEPSLSTMMQRCQLLTIRGHLNNDYLTLRQRLRMGTRREEHIVTILRFL